MAETEKRGNANFTWTQGTRPAPPPPGFEDYFGGGPLWRFIDYDGSEAFDIVDRIREFPTGANAEATMRLLMGDQPAYALSSVQNAIQGLLDLIDADPEIEVRFTVSHPMGNVQPDFADNTMLAIGYSGVL